jgi:allantoin racemase
MHFFGLYQVFSQRGSHHSCEDNHGMDSNITRKFLLINPNTNTLTTHRLQSVLQPLLPSNAQLEFRTASFGANYIACEASHAVASHACVDAWATHRTEAQDQLDGVLIGCFGDPGLFALREVSSCPVTGLAEASFIQAAKHGPFAIVTGGERWKPMLRRLAQSLGYGELLARIETVVPSGAQLQADPQMALQCLSDACAQAAKSNARCVILGGAGLAGYAQALQEISALPLIDSAQAGLEVLLQNQAPAPNKTTDGFYAQWSNMPKAFAQDAT